MIELYFNKTEVVMEKLDSINTSFKKSSHNVAPQGQNKGLFKRIPEHEQAALYDSQ